MFTEEFFYKKGDYFAEKFVKFLQYGIIYLTKRCAALKMNGNCNKVPEGQIPYCEETSTVKGEANG